MLVLIAFVMLIGGVGLLAKGVSDTRKTNLALIGIGLILAIAACLIPSIGNVANKLLTGLGLFLVGSILLAKICEKVFSS